MASCSFRMLSTFLDAINILTSECAYVGRCTVLLKGSPRWVSIKRPSEEQTRRIVQHVSEGKLFGLAWRSFWPVCLVCWNAANTCQNASHTILSAGFS